MALRDQPYLPLYVQDFLTDEKLSECSAQSTGVYIRIMCLMHKSEQYGNVLLKQKHKQTDKQILNFALLLAKHLPYSVDVIESSIAELVEEGVLIIDGDSLIQKRMVKDNELSIKRSLSGKKGGDKSLGKDKDFAQAKSQANSENENENEIENNIKDIDNFSLLLSFLDVAVNSLSLDVVEKSRSFHDAVYEKLLDAGYRCKYEYPIPNGRIDILVQFPDCDVAIELDNRTPRSKNIIKTEGLNLKFISILRDPYEGKKYSQFNIDGIVLYKGRFYSGTQLTPKTWRNDFQTYLSDLNFVYDNLINDSGFIRQQEEFNPGIDIVMSLKKSYTNFWGTEAGWKYKKKQRSKDIDWKATLTNAIGLNKVYKTKDPPSFKPQQKGTSIADVRKIMEENLKNYSNGCAKNKEPFAISQSRGNAQAGLDGCFNGLDSENIHSFGHD